MDRLVVTAPLQLRVLWKLLLLGHWRNRGFSDKDEDYINMRGFANLHGIWRMINSILMKKGSSCHVGCRMKFMLTIQREWKAENASSIRMSAFLGKGSNWTMLFNHTMKSYNYMSQCGEFLLHDCHSPGRISWYWKKGCQRSRYAFRYLLILD